MSLSMVFCRGQRRLPRAQSPPELRRASLIEEIARLAPKRAAELIEGTQRRVLAGGLKTVECRAADSKAARHLNLTEPCSFPQLVQPFGEPLGEIHEQDGRRSHYPYVGSLK